MPATRINPSLLSGLPEHCFRRTCSAARRRNSSAPRRFYSSPVTRATAVIASKTGYSRSRWYRAPAPSAFLAFLGPGAIVGELSIIDGLPRSASVVAVRSSALSCLSRSAFDDVTKKNPDIYKSLVTLLATRLRETDAVIAAGSFLPLRGRVACTLLELAEQFGHDVGAGRIVIRQKLGQSDIAAMAGIARENVSRILNDWKRRKLVSRLSGYYCLEDKQQLRNEAEL